MNTQSEYVKQWRKDNPEKSKAIYKRYRDKNRAARAAYFADYKAKHPDIITAARKNWLKNNPQKQQAIQKAWRATHKEHVRNQNRKYVLLHPERFIESANRRRALQRKATINLKSIQAWMKSVKLKKIAICYYCSQSISTKCIHFDHIIPLSKGGPHSVDNLCVSCESCNRSKGPKTPQAWVRIGQQVLSL